MLLKIANTSCYFTAIAQSLHNVLTKKKVPNELVDVIDLHDRSSVYIIFTVHEGYPLPQKYIAYNFEQLITDRKWSNGFFIRLAQAREVWDYSMENVKVLHSKGLRASFVPWGYNESMEVPSAIRAHNDLPLVLFVGSNNQRRSDIMQRIKAKVNVVSNAWGQELDRVQATHDIGLNIHYYTGKTILEIPRILPQLVAGLWIISERSDDPYYDEKCKDLVTFVDSPNEFNFAIEAVMALTPDERQTEIQARLKRLRAGWKYEENDFFAQKFSTQ
jgi:hypothetical protein